MQLIFEFSTNSVIFLSPKLWENRISTSQVVRLHLTTCEVNQKRLFLFHETGIIHLPAPNQRSLDRSDRGRSYDYQQLFIMNSLSAVSELVRTNLTTCEIQPHNLWGSTCHLQNMVSKSFIIIFLRPYAIRSVKGSLVGCEYVDNTCFMDSEQAFVIFLTSCEVSASQLVRLKINFLTTWATKKSPNLPQTQKSIALGHSNSKSSVERCTAIIHPVPLGKVIPVLNCEVEFSKFSQLRFWGLPEATVLLWWLWPTSGIKFTTKITVSHCQITPARQPSTIFDRILKLWGRTSQVVRFFQRVSTNASTLVVTQ